MATIIFNGKGLVTPQVSTLTVVSGSDTTLYQVSVGAKVVSYTASAGNNATVIAAALVTAWNLRTEAEFLEITATSALGVVTLTGPDTGKPFTVTPGVSGGAGTLTGATPTPASNPQNFGILTNFSNSAGPSNGDTVVFDETSPDVLYGLAAFTAVTWRMDRRAGHTGRIGLPVTDEDGGYPQYRDRYIETAGTSHAVRQGQQDADGQVRIKSTAGSAVTLVVTGEAAGAETVEVHGLPASSVVDVSGAGVVVAPLVGQTATVATLLANNAVFRAGSGTTLTTVTLTGTSAVLGCSWTTLNYDRGSSVLVVLAAAGGTTNADDGALTWRSTGNLGTVKLGSGAALDLSQAPAAVTVTALTLYEGARLNDPASRITRPYDIAIVRAALGEVQIDAGTHMTLTVAAGP